MKTALIIDDEEDYRYLLAEFLKQGGWTVLQAAEGEDGLKQAKSHRPAVVICDVSLPGRNGLDICRALRAEPALEGTGILVSSGRDFEDDRQSALEAGANEFLPKPFPPDQLLRKVARYAPEAAEAAGSSHKNWLQFWGVRGSIPTPGPSTVGYGGNTSCVEVRAEGEVIILDAGTGLRLLGKNLEREAANGPLQLTLLLTHTHWDHIQGLPFFAPLHRPGSQLRVLGFQGARQGLQTVLSSQMESPFFPVGLHQAAAEVKIEELSELTFAIGRVQVEAFRARHPGVCMGYRVSTPSGSVAFFPDNESRAAGAAGGIVTPDPELVGFLQGTDVLILDAQYDAAEYASHVGWGHGCVDDVVGVAVAARVKRLFLFHHDPDHDDAKVSALVAHARDLASAAGSPVEIEAAREGLQVSF